MAEQKKSIRAGHTVGSMALSAIFHILGVSFVFVTILAATVSLDVVRSVVEISWGNALIQEAVMVRGLIQLGLAASLWTMGYLIVKSVDLEMMTKRTPRVVRRARGTVITETIIVLPLLLLLILGLAQLTLNNMTSILKEVASFQAARTAWVWVPEQQAATTGPGAVTEAEVENRVRIAVAMVMTPIATGNYPAAKSDTLTDRAQEMESIMVERFGGTGGGVGQASRMSIVEGLDGNTHQATRAQRKFRHAYNSISDINVVADEDGLVGASVTYAHAQSMPLVGKIFGVDGGNGVHYQLHEIGMVMPSQLYHVCRVGMVCPQMSGDTAEGSFWSD